MNDDSQPNKNALPEKIRARLSGFLKKHGPERAAKLIGGISAGTLCRAAAGAGTRPLARALLCGLFTGDGIPSTNPVT
jgi:hypothetical protein